MGVNPFAIKDFKSTASTFLSNYVTIGGIEIKTNYLLIAGAVIVGIIVLYVRNKLGKNDG